ncbi:MAG: hypothetical protein HMLKMBBP_03794 [Planctomycetes bacterium]|nr:hypothetical protein [Planctomycetota bacterium]
MSPAEAAAARRRDAAALDRGAADGVCGVPMTLDRLADAPEDAHSAIVTGLQGEPGTRERLAELGFTPGTGVTVVSRAPNGGPLRVRVRGGFLALRRDEAAQVRVHPAGDAARAAAGCAA